MKLYGLEFLEEYKPSSHKGWVRKPAIPQIIEFPEKYLQKKPLLISSKKQKAKILILGGDSVTQGWTALQLQKKGVPFISVNLDEFLFEGHFEISTSGDLSLRYGKQVVSLKNISSVLYFAPQFLMGLDAHPEILSSEEKILLSRWKVALHTVHQALKKAKWWPAAPCELYESSQDKFADLILAREMGLKVPDTIMTMDPALAKKFYKKHKGKVIFREFSVRRVHKNGKLNTFKIEFIKPSAKTWSSILASPTVFQQYVEKDCEYRVVVISKKVFVCEIESQKGDKSRMDWRYYETDKVDFKPGKLPSNIESKLIKFTQERGLSMASFDLIKDKKGDFYFLEMNRPGSWLFIEAFTGLPITGYLLGRLG